MDSRIGDIIFRMSKIIKNIVDRIAKLEDIAHPPRKFVSCENCKQKIREIDNGNKG